MRAVGSGLARLQPPHSPIRWTFITNEYMQAYMNLVLMHLTSSLAVLTFLANDGEPDTSLGLYHHLMSLLFMFKSFIFS